MKRYLRVAALAAAMLVAPTAALAAQPETPPSTAQGFEVSSLKAGDRFMDETGRIGIEIPAKPGYVSASAALVNGDSETVEVFVGNDGRVLTRNQKQREAYVAKSRKAKGGKRAYDQGGCSDGSYSHLYGRWYSNVGSYTSSTNKPGYLTLAGFQDDITFGLASITGTRNTCGLADVVPIVGYDAGTTTVVPNIQQGGVCGSSPDTMNVSGYGGFGGQNGVLASNCRWVDVNGATQSTDSKYNNAYYWTANPASCPAGYFVVSAVAAHEWGHGFGLDHVSSASSTLTMKPATGPCTESPAWLGRGDVLGLDAKY